MKIISQTDLLDIVFSVLPKGFITITRHVRVIGWIYSLHILAIPHKTNCKEQCNK